MANSDLQGQCVPIDKDIKKHLSRIYDAYRGNKTKEGYNRLKNLCDSDEISYEQLKRIKNFFDTFSGTNKETPYLLNGGTRMKEWVNKTLENARNDLKGKKKSMKDVGMNNQYMKTHSKDGVKIDPHDSDTNKILRQEGIYNIGMMESFINIVDKNKELWHKHHGNQSHQY